MIKYGNWVWEGTSLETKPGDAEGSHDGQVFKELDTGESYTRIEGVWEYINLGLALIKATKSGLTTTDSTGNASVTYATPFIDTDYTVQLTCDDIGEKLAVPFKANVTITGFDIVTRDKNGKPIGNVEVSWLSTRSYNP